jgi:hypothetical protein
MYTATLFIHSWLRYLVLGLGLLLLVGSAGGLRKGWTSGLERLHVSFMAVLDVQLLLGLWLYLVLSPIAGAARAHMGLAMKDPQLRFFGVEHFATMLIAIVIAHIGRARSKKKGNARSKSVLITQCIWLLLTLAAIPWPGLDIGRPLFRL